MSLVVLDTDVASALLRQRAPETLARQVPAITFVSVGELTKWPWCGTGVHAAWQRCGLSSPGSLATLNIKDYTDYAEHEGLQLLR